MLPANCSKSISNLWSEAELKYGLHLMKGWSLAPFPSTAQAMTHTPFLSLTTAPSRPWKYKMKWIEDIETIRNQITNRATRSEGLNHRVAEHIQPGVLIHHDFFEGG